MNDPQDGAAANPSTRTRQMLACLFPEDEGARWLRRDNPGFGCAPLRLIEQGRETEVQRYLARWMQPAEPPPATFESLFGDPGGSAP